VRVHVYMCVSVRACVLCVFKRLCVCSCHAVLAGHLCPMCTWCLHRMHLWEPVHAAAGSEHGMPAPPWHAGLKVLSIVCMCMYAQAPRLTNVLRALTVEQSPEQRFDVDAQAVARQKELAQRQASSRPQQSAKQGFAATELLLGKCNRGGWGQRARLPAAITCVQPAPTPGAGAECQQACRTEVAGAGKPIHLRLSTEPPTRH